MPKARVEYVMRLDVGLIHYLTHQLMAEEDILAQTTASTGVPRPGLVALVRERVHTEITAINRHLEQYAGVIPEARPLFADRNDLFEWQGFRDVWLVYRIIADPMGLSWYGRLFRSPPVTIQILQVLYGPTPPSHIPLFLQRLIAEILPR